MTGLEKLYTRAKIAENNGNQNLANQLSSIADEINRDFLKVHNGVAWRNLAEFMNDILDGKYNDIADPGIYRRCNDTDSFQEWLDKWYIPRPLDADGEPIRFGDLFEYEICGKTKKLPVTGFRIYSDGREQLYIETGPGCAYIPRVEDAKRASTDSIEKLRGEMLNLTYASAEEAESLVDEWLARAEKLFGGDVE